MNEDDIGRAGELLAAKLRDSTRAMWEQALGVPSTGSGVGTWTTAAGPGLTLDALREIERRFSAPMLGVVLVDDNLPADLLVKIPRDEAVVRQLYGTGASGDEAWAAVARLRDQDFAIVVPRAVEMELRRMGMAVAVPAGPLTRETFAGVPVRYVRSLRDAPWRRLLLSHEITEFFAAEAVKWKQGHHQ